MGWFHRNNCAYCVWHPRSILMRAPPKRINKQNDVGNYLHERWINSILGHYFQENLQQPRFWATYVNRKWTFVLFSRDFEQILGQIVSLRVNTLSNTNLAASGYINEKKAYIWLKNVSHKTSVLKLDIDFECDNIGCSFPDFSRH